MAQCRMSKLILIFQVAEQDSIFNGSKLNQKLKAKCQTMFSTFIIIYKNFQCFLKCLGENGGVVDDYQLIKF